MIVHLTKPKSVERDTVWTPKTSGVNPVGKLTAKSAHNVEIEPAKLSLKVTVQM